MTLIAKCLGVTFCFYIVSTPSYVSSAEEGTENNGKIRTWLSNDILSG